MEAVLNAPKPRNVSQLKGFLGLVNFYARFLPDLSIVLSPLYNLLKKYSKWYWSKECQQSFDEVKQLLCSADMLVLYDPRKPLRLSCDASGYGLGAELSQETEPNVFRPVAYASRTMTEAEQKYSQFEKEGLALVFGIKNNHKFLYAREFTLITDHSPLTSLFGPKHSFSGIATARIHRWRLLLAEYKFKIKYQKGSCIGDADALSRLPLQTTEGEEHTLNYFQPAEAYPLNFTEVQEETKKDKMLQRKRNLFKPGGRRKCRMRV